MNEKKLRYRYRPAWHKRIGVAVLAVGLYTIFANDLMRLTRNVQLLPGGHSELYLLAGIVVTVGSLWWFGWFDSRSGT
ncbi:hypothetical protein [Kineococcus rubinsiae]|uniref:hypothetical protein n=1 Tax=Kineococcus rubinsiae TaxID=2609562 RepID=UPI001431B943|nr:hypothetical protein [Kineococcus rubinsiae]NIZ92560.1 hypothetical protein [Kineococcus rubinsiae]